VRASDDKPASLADGFGAWLALAQPGDYVAIQSYLEPSAEIATALQGFRSVLRDRMRVATTLGWAPRSVHSTGQLHRGGPPSGLYIQLVGEDDDKLAIPGAGYDFSTFRAAQALADLDALHAARRRAIRLRLLGKAGPALAQLSQLVRAATRRL